MIVNDNDANNGNNDYDDNYGNNDNDDSDDNDGNDVNNDRSLPHHLWDTTTCIKYNIECFKH